MSDAGTAAAAVNGSPPSASGERKLWTAAHVRGGVADSKSAHAAVVAGAASSNAAAPDEPFSFTTGIAHAPKFQSRTTASCYGAFHHTTDHRAVDTRVARYLPPRKNEVGNSVKISQVNAVPAGASSATAALQKSSGLAFSGGAKGALRVTGPRAFHTTAHKLESFTRVNPSHMVKWTNAGKTEQQMSYVNQLKSPEYIAPEGRHFLKVADRNYKEALAKVTHKFK